MYYIEWIYASNVYKHIVVCTWGSVADIESNVNRLIKFEQIYDWYQYNIVSNRKNVNTIASTNRIGTY